MKSLKLCLALLLLIGVTARPATGQEIARRVEIGIVVYVVDGDTIDVQLGDTIYRVRYIGMNTPERGEPCFQEATAANAALVDGKTVAMVRDVSETDQFDRLLRYVYVGGVFVNAALVTDGWAESVRYPPDTLFAAWFDTLAAPARAAGLGCYPTGVFGDAPTAPAVPTPEAAPGWNCVGNRYNCSHFTTCEELMSYWTACPGDPSRLDGDHDGIPCESMACAQ